MEMKNIQIKLKPLLFLFVLGIAFSSCSTSDDSETDPDTPAEVFIIDYNIDSDTVLTNHLPGVDYEICGSIDIKANLIIEPGVEIVMCAGSRITIERDGSLNAVGSNASPIIFRGKTASPGFWQVLHFNSNNPSNELNHVVIADGGGANSFENATIWVNDNNAGQLTLKNSTISNSKGIGLLVEGIASIPNFSNNTFSNNGDSPVSIAMSNIGALDVASNYADGNTKNQVYVKNATVNQPQMVKNINVPYLIKGSSDIKSDLKLEPGVRFLMSSGAVIDVNNSGSMNALGTSNKPITIKGEVDAVGYWAHIHFNSNNPLNKFTHVNIKNGGSRSSYKYSSIWVNDNNNGSFNMTDCTIADSYGWGVYVENGATMIPSTKSEVESVNTFINNGSGTNADCTDTCSIYLP